MEFRKIKTLMVGFIVGRLYLNKIMISVSQSLFFIRLLLWYCSCCCRCQQSIEKNFKFQQQQKKTAIINQPANIQTTIWANIKTTINNNSSNNNSPFEINTKACDFLVTKEICYAFVFYFLFSISCFKLCFSSNSVALWPHSGGD